MQRTWLREFNSLGLQLRPQAAKVVTDYLREQDDPMSAVEALVENTKQYFKVRQGTVEPVITAEVVDGVIQHMQKMAEEPTTDAAAALDVAADGIQIFDCLKDVWPFDYLQATKEWVRALERPQIFPGVDMKAKIYKDRFHILWQRLLLEGHFVPEARVFDGLLPGQRVLTPAESLMGNPGRKTTFGLIFRELDEEGNQRWVLEDLHRVVALRLEIQESPRLITNGCFVLAEGQMDKDTFCVSAIDVPSAVTRETTKTCDQIPVQMFGGESSEEQLKLLQQREEECTNGAFVVLSEVLLDNGRALEKLQELFDGYEATEPPSAYVFMGSFCSSSFVPTADGVRAYREGFDRLKFMLRRLTRHMEVGTRYIFIPGPKDPGASMLPRAQLSPYLTAEISKEIPNVTLATNPCRLRHFTKDLVFFRHDVLRLLRRNEVVPLREVGTGEPLSPQQIREEMVALLLDQAHLVPLPLSESNILWAFDHTLRLYPLPDAVFVGGESQQFDCTYKKCCFASVGPFYRDVCFYAYNPLKDVLEYSEIPDRIA